MKRKDFLKRSLAAFFGLVISPAFIKGDAAFAITKPKNVPVPAEWDDDDITISWIGHATVLINFYGRWILTDPVLFERVGLYFLGGTWGPTRYTAPALNADTIPKPDLILLSHAHMDHMDFLTLKTIAGKYPNQIDVVTSYLTKDVIEELPWRSLTELDWGYSFSINGINLRAYEVRHFGWRFPWEKDRSKGFFKDGRSYNAYVIERNGKKILFGGDTALTDKLDVLKGENIEAAIMPIGAYRPWKRVHCNPEEALMMADRIGVKYFIPIHCNTFDQGREPHDEPLKWVTESSVRYNLKLGLNEIGQTFVAGAA